MAKKRTDVTRFISEGEIRHIQIMLDDAITLDPPFKMTRTLFLRGDSYTVKLWTTGIPENPEIGFHFKRVTPKAKPAEPKY